MPLGASFAMLDQSREGREFWRVVQMSTHDVLCEYFEHDKVRMHFARIAGENLVSPDEKATGLGVFVFVGFMEAYGIGVPIGGSGQLTDALIACIRDHGGEVLANVDVARVIVKQRSRGRSRARRTAANHGRSDAVIGAIHPHHWPHGRGHRCRRRRGMPQATRFPRSRASPFTPHSTAPLRFKAGEQVRAVMIELLPNELRAAAPLVRDLRYGGFSKYPLVGFGSLTDSIHPAYPPASATMHAWDYVPYTAPDGRSWDEAKRDYAERMSEHMGSSSRTRQRRTSRSITATAQWIWSAPHRASSAAICMASPPRPINQARIDRRRSSVSSPCRVSSVCIWSGHSSIPAAACSEPAARRR